MTDPITLAIPYYRGPEYLRTAIESVLAQEDEHWRLTVCDDSERDEARGVIEALGLSTDPRVRCIQNSSNLGMVGNWNACLDYVATPLGSLLHADDALQRDYVGTMRKLAAAYPGAAAFFCGARVIDARGFERFSFADWIKRFYLPRAAAAAPEFPLQGENALRALMAGNFIMCPTLCYRMDTLAGRRFDANYQQVQDLELTSRLLMDGDMLVGSHARAYAYRRHADAATTRQSASLLRFREEFALFDVVAKRARERGWERAARVARRKTVVRLHLAYRAIGDLLHLRVRLAARALRLAGCGGRRRP